MPSIVKTTAAALSAGLRFSDFCSAGGTARVSGVFDRAVNLSAKDGIFSIVSMETGRSPSSLTVSGVNGLGLAADEICSCRPGRIYFKNAVVDFSQAPVWRGRIDRTYRCKPLDESVCAFKAAIGRNGGDWFADSRLADGMRKLLPSPEEAALGLIGLGPGLTPAGDDAVLGFVAALNHFTGGKYLNRLRAAVAGALGATTDLSAQLLKNALRYEYHEFVENALTALCGPPEAVSPAAAKLLGVGASSGAYIAAGIYHAAAFAPREE